MEKTLAHSTVPATASRTKETSNEGKARAYMRGCTRAAVAVAALSALQSFEARVRDIIPARQGMELALALALTLAWGSDE